VRILLIDLLLEILEPISKSMLHSKYLILVIPANAGSASQQQQRVIPFFPRIS
jgi:hypothetical protein